MHLSQKYPFLIFLILLIAINVTYQQTICDGSQNLENCQCNGEGYMKYEKTSAFFDCSSSVCIDYNTENICYECQSNYYLSSQVCMLCDQVICDENYGDICGTCVACQIPSCKNCNGDQYTCTLCQDTYYWTGDQCELCQTLCLCVESSDNCIGCIDNRFILTNDGCDSCEAPCSTCEGTKDHCLTCLDELNFHLSQDNKCVCSDGKYGYNDPNNGWSCQTCSSSCKTCEDISIKCTSCTENKILTSDNTCQCDLEYYQKDQDCFRCISPCYSCISDSICSRCIGMPNVEFLDQKCNCISGYFFDRQQNSCVQCDSNCLTCQNNSNSCLSCYTDKNYVLSECLDDYFEYNEYGCIYCQSEEAKVIQKCNYSNCSDGIWSYGEQCDDGNKQNQDGCYNCKIEQSFYCINQILQPSVCFKCQENCLKCYYDYDKQTDYCLVANTGYFIYEQQIQRCNIKCKSCSINASNCTYCQFIDIGVSKINCQLCEYKQGYYSNYDNNQCFTQCGDGLVADTEQCDDGNLINNDGCDNKCKIEHNYVCDNNNDCKIVPAPYPYIKQSSDYTDISNPRRQILVNYDQILSLPLDFNISKIINISVQSLDDELSFEYTVEQNIKQINSSQQLEFYIDLNFSTSITDGELVIIFTNTGQIANIIGNHQKITRLAIQISNIDYLSDSIKNLVSNVGAESNAQICFLISLLLIGVIFGGIEIFYNFLDILQNYSYLSFLNLQFPSNYQEFIKSFRIFQFNYIQGILNLQNLFSYFQTGFLDKLSETSVDLKNTKFAASFLINSIIVQLIFLFSFFIYILLNIFKYKFYNLADINQIESKNYTQIQYFQIFLKSIVFLKIVITLNEFIYSGLLRLVQANAIEISFALILGLNGISFENRAQLINSLITIFFTVLYFVIILFFVVVVNKNSFTFKSLAFEKKFGSSIEGLKISKFSIQFNAYLLIKKFLFMAFLIQLYSTPIYQIGSIFILYLVTFIYMLVFRPQKQLLEQIKQLICEFTLVMFLLFMTVLQANKEQNIFTQQAQRSIGWICMSCVIFALTTQTIVDSIQQLQYLYINNSVVKKIISYCLSAVKLQKKPQKTDIKIFTK